MANRGKGKSGQRIDHTRAIKAAPKSRPPSSPAPNSRLGRLISTNQLQQIAWSLLQKLWRTWLIVWVCVVAGTVFLTYLTAFKPIQVSTTVISNSNDPFSVAITVTNPAVIDRTIIEVDSYGNNMIHGKTQGATGEILSGDNYIVYPGTPAVLIPDAVDTFMPQVSTAIAGHPIIFARFTVRVRYTDFWGWRNEDQFYEFHVHKAKEGLYFFTFDAMQKGETRLAKSAMDQMALEKRQGELQGNAHP